MSKKEDTGGSERQKTQSVGVLKQVLVEQLRDLLHAENQLVKALPKMANAARDVQLKQGFQQHLKQTEGHVERLNRAFEQLDETARGKECKGMMGLVEEGAETIEEGKDKDDVSADLALIAAAQKVEHYEISGYGTVRAMAESMGQSEVAKLLYDTEQEEKDTDERLTKAAQPLLRRASG